MRAESRIYPFCNHLAAAWAKCPDMRFWQFLLNGYASKRDPFFVEDEEAIKMIEAAAETYSPYHKGEN